MLVSFRQTNQRGPGKVALIGRIFDNSPLVTLIRRYLALGRYGLSTVLADGFGTGVG